MPREKNDPRPLLSYDFLFEEYVTKNKKAKQIAKETGFGESTVACLLSKYEIKKGYQHYNDKYPILTKEFLIEEYQNKGKSTSTLNKELNIPRDTILARLHKFDIPVRKTIDYEEDLTGKIFGELTVIGLFIDGQLKGKRQKRLWQCKCSCGNEKITTTAKLNSGANVSCGHLEQAYFFDKRKEGKDSIYWTGYADLSGTFLGKIRSRAKNKNIEFNLTAEYLWDLYIKQNKRCALTGIILRIPQPGEIGAYEYDNVASVDRKDPSKGYVIGNVQFVSAMVNSSKWHYEESRFIDMCSLVHNNNFYKTQHHLWT